MITTYKVVSTGSVLNHAQVELLVVGTGSGVNQRHHLCLLLACWHSSLHQNCTARHGSNCTGTLSVQATTAVLTCIYHSKSLHETNSGLLRQKVDCC